MYAKCIRHSEFGLPQDVLKVEFKETLPPKDNEVLVRMLARPINPSDLLPIIGFCYMEYKYLKKQNIINMVKPFVCSVRPYH